MIIFHLAMPEDALEKLAIARSSGFTRREHALHPGTCFVKHGDRRPESAKTQASDNRIWFVELQVAKGAVNPMTQWLRLVEHHIHVTGRPPSSAMQWFRFSEMLSHPALKGRAHGQLMAVMGARGAAHVVTRSGLEILWDVSESLRDEAAVSRSPCAMNQKTVKEGDGSFFCPF